MRRKEQTAPSAHCYIARLTIFVIPNASFSENSGVSFGNFPKLTPEFQKAWRCTHIITPSLGFTSMAYLYMVGRLLQVV